MQSHATSTMPFDHRRRPDSSVEKIMLRYRVLPYEEDDDNDIPTITFRPGVQSYTRRYTRSYSPIDLTKTSAPRITTATYRYKAPYTPSAAMNITRNSDASDLENSVNQFLADMDLRRKFRSLESGSSRPTITSNSGGTNHDYKTSKGHTSKRIYNTYDAHRPQQQKWSSMGQLFAKDVHDVLSKTRKQLMQTSPKYRPTTAGHSYTEPRNSDRSSYYTWTAPTSKVTTKSSKNYSSNYQYKSSRHSTPVKDKSIQSDTPTYQNSKDVSQIDEGNANHEHDESGKSDDEKANCNNRPELERSDSRPDGLVMWEDIDLDDIIEDTDDEDDFWQKDKVMTVIEPGKFVGHGFRTEPVRMTEQQGSVTWAKPRGELDIIITQGDNGQDFVCKIQTQRQGVRVSQLMSEGEEEVLFSGKNDLESGQFQSFQGHIVLMLEALCTPFLKKVFEMNYEIVNDGSG